MTSRSEYYTKEMKYKMNNNIYTYENAFIKESISEPMITIDGSMRVDVPLVVDGRDVMREIDEMRDALLLLKRDVDMESKYPKLKELKDAYEAQLEKYKTWEAIK